MGVDAWIVAQAKAKFSEVINKARSLGPQTITRHGRKAAVVVADDEWERKTRRSRQRLPIGKKALQMRLIVR